MASGSPTPQRTPRSCRPTPAIAEQADATERLVHGPGQHLGETRGQQPRVDGSRDRGSHRDLGEHGPVQHAGDVAAPIARPGSATCTTPDVCARGAAAHRRRSVR